MSISIGVVGAGFGLNLINTLATSPKFCLAGIADRNASRDVQAIASQFNTNAYRDGSDLIRCEKPDALVLALPPQHRSALIEEALAAGIALFIEKPLAATVAQANELVEKLGASRAAVMMGFSFRFHTSIVRAKKMLSADLGAPLLANGAYVFDWRPAPDSWLWDRDRGGGFFNENSCHLFDVVCHLMGRPQTVFASGSSYLDQPGPIGAAISLSFASGAVAALTVGGIGVGAKGDFPRLDLITENGDLRLEGRDHMWTGLEWTMRGSDHTQRFSATPERLSETRYTRAFEHFAHCIETTTAPSATPGQGLLAVEIADAIYQSLERAEPISLANKGSTHL